MYSYNCRHLDDWIEIVDSGKQPTNKEMKLLVQMVKLALESKDTFVDTRKINDCIEFIERYRPYTLAPIQRFIHACYSGIFYNNGDIVFDETLLLCARGFGKNSIASDAALYLTSNRHGISNYNVDIVANNETQAKTSFTDCHETIGDSNQLIKAYRRTLSEIEFINTRSKIKYHTSNARTKDGLRPGIVIFDEIHEYEDYSQLKVFRSALGKVKHGRIFYLTTDGNLRGAVIDDFKELAKEVLSNLDWRSGFLPIYCKIDKFEEWDTEVGWIKANPMLPFLPELMKRYRKDYKTSLKSKDMKIEFLTKRLNHPLEDTTYSVASWDDIIQTNQEIPDLTGEVCVGGLDYADVRDFIAVGLLFKKNNKRYWIHHTFIVSESLRLQQFKMDFEIPRSEGLVTIVPGNIMDPQLVSNWFVDMSAKYKIKAIAMDRFRKNAVKEVFDKDGLPIEEVGSGYVTHNKLAPLVDMMFANHNLVFGNDRMMRWYTNNVYVDVDPKGNKSYKKIDPEKRKTDGFMAFIHALSLDEQLDKPIPKIRRGLKTVSY
ncbi:terminase TerL endonuclease subunit [Vaginisenegalia massiliensis]|uniref:terminase TerL endonuclease subunit n=1 Tax=Vaginisenegalia massiliensis TaxID=2058294 RepID=UPI000F535866|nr:terminase TerL endonuclease subunit [Vaginisenegalia massiliensis]